jgi:hypothetical protein
VLCGWMMGEDVVATVAVAAVVVCVCVFAYPLVTRGVVDPVRLGVHLSDACVSSSFVCLIACYVGWLHVLGCCVMLIFGKHVCRYEKGVGLCYTA